MSSFPCLAHVVSGTGEVRYSLGDWLVDRYLEFVAVRCLAEHAAGGGLRSEGVLLVIGKDLVEVTAADVFEFLAYQQGDRTVVRVTDRELDCRHGLSPAASPPFRACMRYLVAWGDTPVQANVGS